ncbi:MAG TPA: PilZ domain-containing protein [Candidatus Omnitrophota bacterium]|nr:PilZ domain-containing protein [Candidatus Omnitrophota bacterium]
MAFFIGEGSGQERRQFKRIKCNSPIEYKFFNSNRFQQTVTCDISEGGVSFIIDGFIPNGTHLYFQAHLKNRPQDLYGIAKVCWCSKEPYNEKYRVGLEFTEVGSISKEDIVALIRENKAPCYNS